MLSILWEPILLRQALTLRGAARSLTAPLLVLARAKGDAWPWHPTPPIPASPLGQAPQQEAKYTQVCEVNVWRDVLKHCSYIWGNKSVWASSPGQPPRVSLGQSLLCLSKCLGKLIFFQLVQTKTNVDVFPKAFQIGFWAELYRPGVGITGMCKGPGEQKNFSSGLYLFLSLSIK